MILLAYGRQNIALYLVNPQDFQVRKNGRTGKTYFLESQSLQEFQNMFITGVKMIQDHIVE